MKNKLELRKQFMALRKTLNINTKSKIIVKKIQEITDYKSAKNVLLYYPLEYEVNVLPLMKDSKNFYFPKVQEKNLLVCPNCDKFRKSDMHIFEPCSNPVDPNILDLIIVPALAADKNGYRLGYGGGFYDRFLEKHPNIKTISPIFKELYTDNLPTESFDIKINRIITD